MLELLFKGLFQWLYELFLELVEFTSNALLGVFAMDLSYFMSVAPVAADIMGILRAVGWALLLGNLVFQAAKSMLSGAGFEGEDPKLLFTRTFAFSFLLIVSDGICAIGLDLTQTVIDLLRVPSSVTVQMPTETIFNTGAAWLLVLVIGVVVGWQYIKLCIEVGERYVVLASLTILAPLAFGVGGSQNTSDIFKGWARMYASMCFMMVSSVIFLKMLISALGYVPVGLDAIPWAILVVAIARVARKVDEIITRIGLNPAITGGGLGRSLPGVLTYAVVRSMAGTVGRTLGKSAGGPKTPPAGSGAADTKTGPKAGSWHGRNPGHAGPHAPGTAGRQKPEGGTFGQSTGPAKEGAATVSAEHAPPVSKTPDMGPERREAPAGTSVSDSAAGQHSAEASNSQREGKESPGSVEQERGERGSASRRSSVPTDGRVSAIRPRPAGRGIDVDASDFEDGETSMPRHEQTFTSGISTSETDGQDTPPHSTRFTNVPKDTAQAPRVIGAPETPPNAQQGGSARAPAPGTGIPPTGAAPTSSPRDHTDKSMTSRPAIGAAGISPAGGSPASTCHDPTEQGKTPRPAAGATGKPPAGGSPTSTHHDPSELGNGSRPATGATGTPPAGGSPTSASHAPSEPGKTPRPTTGAAGMPPTGGAQPPSYQGPPSRGDKSRPVAGLTGTPAPGAQAANHQSASSSMTVNQGGFGPTQQDTTVRMTESPGDGAVPSILPSPPHMGAPRPQPSSGRAPQPPSTVLRQNGLQTDPTQRAPASGAGGVSTPPDRTTPPTPSVAGHTGLDRPPTPTPAPSSPPPPRAAETPAGPKLPEQPKGIINRGVPKSVTGGKRRKKKSRRGKGGT